MKVSTSLLVFGLCGLLFSLAVVNGQGEDDDSLNPVEFDPSLYANEITKLIGDVNQDLRTSRITLHQLERAVSRYGQAFGATARTVREFEETLKKIAHGIHRNRNEGMLNLWRKQ